MVWELVISSCVSIRFYYFHFIKIEYLDLDPHVFIIGRVHSIKKVLTYFKLNILRLDCFNKKKSKNANRWEPRR